jgi:SAM-dependent methyltransferase
MDFDEYSSDYSRRVDDALPLSDCDHDFFLTEKADHFLRLLSNLGPTESMRVLDVGCGVGLVEQRLSRKVKKIVGVDLGVATLRTAVKNAPDASALAYDGLQLPLRANSFDAALAICVLHHVPQAARGDLIREIARTVRPGGFVAVFEHNPWNPVTRYVVNRCEFDRGVALLSAPVSVGLLRGARLTSTQWRFLFFFPWLGRLWRAIESYLEWLPLGAQYVSVGYVPAERPPTVGMHAP